ncbi:predicted protein [Naegleria gruberi]|uniref:Predicted protein n=1 Tax=Naegleria gruberi TaxID=5762 RepID=D2V8J9_NAEGR|nr:uncharacterized protein NAEGRDRAFT_79007 [Naegleria gruberi]EFC46699.1 predicted protein [Naegleria gruberi]|eukprot:XP_002679443.1 predicted protein [Naegleria gruberi strain NEG-M]
MSTSTLIKPQAGKNFVVCIDFGSSGSGSSILFVKDEDKIFTLKTYPDSPNVVYNKNMSCILYEDGKRHSIGYTARKTMFFENDDEDSDEDSGEDSDRDSDSESEESHGSTSTAPSKKSATPLKDRKFIRDLKIQFMEATKDEKEISIPEIVISNDGTTKSLLDVMADYLSMLFTDFIMKSLKNNDSSVKKTDVRWCITVPANYSEHQKSLMRKVACKAKIIDKENCDESDLIIISEPDAATMFCMKHKAKSKPLTNGETFMVVDAGGGTVDVSCHMLENGKLKELAVQKAELCGSTFIDREFIKILEENCDNFKEFTEKNPETLVKILSIWEDVKRGTLTVDKKLTFDTSPMFKKAKPNSSIYKSRSTKIALTDEQMKRIFDSQVSKALKLIDEVYRDYEEDYPSRKMDHLFIVGGLGDNGYFQNRIKERFEKKFKEILIPLFCSTALSYGVGVMEEFEEGHHAESKYKVINGKHMAVDVLDVFVEQREEVEIDREIVREYECLPGATQIDVVLYSSIKRREAIPYIDSPLVSKEETITIPFRDSSKEADRRVFIKFFFGKSELMITVENAQGEVKEIKRDFEANSLALK